MISTKSIRENIYIYYKYSFNQVIIFLQHIIMQYLLCAIHFCSILHHVIIYLLRILIDLANLN